MKKNLKRITAMLAALLITTMPVQAFAGTGCNLQSNVALSQAKVKSSYSKIFSGSNCDLLKSWGFKDIKSLKNATPIKNTVTKNRPCDTAGCDLSKAECNGNDCVADNDCDTSKNCDAGDKKNNEATNCNLGKETGNNGSNNAGKDVNNNTGTSNNNQSNADPETPVVAASEAQQVTQLVNKERAAAGLASLTLDASLSKVAQAKAEDMAKNGYFSHTSPTYGSPFDMMKSFGVKYSAAGENIAKGQRSAESVMNAWMNSSGHRANILSSNYDKIGVGYTTDAQGNTYWVQMFIR